MNERSAESESPSALIDRLSGIVMRLISVADRMTDNETVETLSTRDPESLSEEAIEVRNERLQLVEAWTALESEQRQHLLEQAAARPRANAVEQKSPQANPPSNPLDSTTQFRLLKREYDRTRNRKS